ncbi:molybdopterin molybdotransferase MoeA [Robiginitalea aurantiaca]|uniref:Molybdopterin molybdenumtransferase n=1 Tax=Robiginitalea aurantiaca TaxID=3056915 RepID=A0ABT7WFQ0_9FLAO|nr:molybdopterin molybdotransferase MoeA [Robiginitalea aurantiaca]MDM9631744.1 molybdopterin molybdotransferase MoeA [Robiginitalea aurantiaca]
MENIFITYENALSILAAHSEDFPVEDRKLEDSIGGYLAEDLIADRDFPPFDRVTMDGIAISYPAFEKGQREFAIEDIAPAGTPQKSLQDTQHCIEVMTGAIMPENADTVVRYEDLEINQGKARIVPPTLMPKQNVHFKGIDRDKGSIIVPAGVQLSSAEINIAAAVGKASLKVRRMPRVVIVSTGDELVDVHQQPELHQIRRSNIYGIQSTLKTWGVSSDLRHLPDDRDEMELLVSKYLDAYDLLIFTGGVSKGKFDYLPEVLESLNIEKHFHKIQQRPGKPFWFGSNKEGKKIFALPGNPVSSFVCVYVYLKFWLNTCLGVTSKPLYVSLKRDVNFKPNLVYFLEARLESQPDGTLVADPVSGNGSGDFANLVNTDGFLVLPQNKTEFKTGEVYLFVPYRCYS